MKFISIFSAKLVEHALRFIPSVAVRLKELFHGHPARYKGRSQAFRLSSLFATDGHGIFLRSMYTYVHNVAIIVCYVSSAEITIRRVE